VSDRESNPVGGAFTFSIGFQMTKYYAFLRGINVGGRVVKMNALTVMFQSLKLKNVKTFIQSGNVIFESPEKDRKAVAAKIEKKLLKELGYEVPALLRTQEELGALIKLDPFKGMKPAAKPYVTFIAEELKEKLKFPHVSEKDGVEIIGVKNADIFCLPLPLKGGRWGFPNAYIEKQFKVPATTRNWNTVTKIVQIT
jgi:uncharacterized protein (DUF1697 family)